ncbi:MAG: glycosyltransferase family 4 protein, partial [Thermoleophilia bacterium]|nr:glycosyltransferase family 4 protein [Thermoleophilia bacterium]
LRAIAATLALAPGSVRLTLAGPDWRGGRSRLERLARELGIEGALEFTGPVQAPEVARLLDEAHCSVIVSRHEGFSLSATEALLRGAPLILSRETGVASYPEIAELSHVLLVEPELDSVQRALSEVARDRERLRAEAERARPRVAELFSWARIAARHLEAYAALGSGR